MRPRLARIISTPVFLPLALLLSLAACQQESNPPIAASEAEAESAFEQRTVEEIADEYLAALLEANPEMGTYYSLPGARHDRLSDNSLEALAEWQARQDAWLEELSAIGMPVDVGSRDWVTYGILYESLAGSAETRICRSELWAASPTTAWYTGIPVVFEIQPVGSEDEQQQALDRLGALPSYIENEIAKLRLGLELGYSAPRLTVEAAPRQVRALLEEDSPLLSPGVRSGNPDYAAQVQAVFDEEVAPAIESFADFLETKYLPQAREDIGLGSNPDGEGCYPALVRYFATIEPTAAEIHQIGLDQMAVIHGEMQLIIDEHFPGESIESLMRNLNTDPQYTFSNEEEVLQYSVDAAIRAEAKMPEAFGRLPKAEVLIKPYPAYRGDATGEYHPSSEDGSRPGIFYIAVGDPKHRSRATQQSTLHHETYPGHHLQSAIALELGDRVHPLVRYLYNSGFGEGWGLYSERLADELDLYSGPLDRMGMLSDQAARAARLVVDSGMHTMGWTRQQAVDYMLANTAWAALDIESDINRYISWPGQANAYMLGMLEFRRLRDLAETELGEQFDLRAFHDRLLENGAITLPMLDASVREWVAEQGCCEHN